MDLNDAEILLIKNFLHKRMTPAEEQAFNARVDTDTEFRSEVDFYTNMFATLRDQERDRLKKMLEEVEQANFPKQSKRPTWGKWLAILLGLAVLAWFLFWRNTKATNEERFFVEYFKPYENTVQVITRSPQTNVEQAWQYYDQGKYALAAAQFSQMKATDKNADSEFFEAMALMAAGNTERAIPLFERMESDSLSHKYQQPARWYLALAFLRTGKLNDFKKMSEKVKATPNHFNADKMNALNEQMTGH
ncbi:MAG: hypothetical protein JNJ57_11580 [Saprospiraceae bacterium]|nr:hypothetical protein [Saprospiraceae bacterium]